MYNKYNFAPSVTYHDMKSKHERILINLYLDQTKKQNTKAKDDKSFPLFANILLPYMYMYYHICWFQDPSIIVLHFAIALISLWYM